jgi:hypothetical protein
MTENDITVKEAIAFLRITTEPKDKKKLSMAIKMFEAATKRMAAAANFPRTRNDSFYPG